ncbi:MAG: DUF4405 domain-containing protein [Geminicoccaceae bacterium]|nr:MAG: DUF4405 domain-containing protein [Geminicoccaceae bacterium]
MRGWCRSVPIASSGVTAVVRQGFSYRGFTSLLVLANFVVMSVTGIVLYVVPSGRVANWLDWTFLSLAKDDWAAIHISSSLIFVVAGVLHLVNNWKPFVHHVRERMARHSVRPKKEAVAAFVGMVLIVAGTIADLPPFSYLMQLNEAAKGMWSLQVSEEPPFSRAEEATLALVAARTGRSPEAVVAALGEAGLTVQGPNDVIRAIADRNDLSPAGVYARLQQGLASTEPSGPAWLQEARTVDDIKLHLGDSGLGRKTVGQIAQELGLAPADLQARFAALGIHAAQDARLRELAEVNGMGTTDLIAAALLGPNAR